MKYRPLAIILVLTGILDFFAFAMVGGMLGGAAIHGKTEGDRYYLGGHGGMVEVSRATFTYSRIHGYTVLVTVPLAVLSVAFLCVKKRRSSAQG